MEFRMKHETGRRYDSESRVEGSGDVIVDWTSISPAYMWNQNQNNGLSRQSK